jgi:Family of unknown function (DUF5681)
VSRRYRVGKGKPPLANRFKKGQSGNPKGRPKGRRNLASELRAELRETVTVREGGIAKKVSKKRGIVKSVMAKGLQGNVSAANSVISMIERMEGDDPLDLTAPIETDEVQTLKALMPQFLKWLEQTGDGHDS